MSYQLSPRIESMVRQQMVSGGYSSEEDVLSDALMALEEARRQHEEMKAEIQIGFDDMQAGRVGPLDLEWVRNEAKSRMNSPTAE